MPRGVIVLAHEGSICAAVRAECDASGRPYELARDGAELERAASAIEWSDAVIDHDHDDAEVAVAALAGATGNRRVLVVVRDTASRPFAGAHVVVFSSVLQRALGELSATRPPSVPSSLEHMSNTSVLGGPLDDAIDGAAHELAVAFGVARCIISDRTEPASGAVPTEGATFDAEAWNITSQRCRAAVTLGATLIAPAPHEPGSCDSYVAVRLEGPGTNVGFVALLATGARVFSNDDCRALRAVATRLGRELRWRAIHDRTSEELERALSGPGLDPQLGIWNRAALDQLAHGYVSSAKRYKLALTVLAVRVVDLEGVNTRHGMTSGDRLLRRIADALKPALRAEDLVGRYSGTVMAVVLQGAGPDDAKRVAERVRAMLGERSFELPNGESLKIATTIGISAAHPDEDASSMLARTALSTKEAPDNSIEIVQPQTTGSGRLPRITDTPATELRATLGGTYRLRHEISRGGMGVVYRADDLALERPVAIKMLRPDLAEDKELIQRLRREAALLARLHHPNLVQIYNLGQSEGDCYFVMELVEGESMQQAIERHRTEESQMPIAELLAVIDQIASALDALHDRGIVHRDVKPANFIRDPFSGRAVLVDVGIAHTYGDAAKQQAGTPGFMAPEVIQGILASVRSDVYGLAASAFSMLTLAPPWGTGEPIEIITRQCSDPPARASSLRPELAPIDEVLANAMSFDIDHRPRSAGALSTALSRALGTILPPATSRARGSRARTDVTGAPKTRGIVIRSVARALGVRDADRLRDAIGSEHAELAQALAQCAPLAWMPAELLLELLAVAPAHVSREPAQLARDVARATVRSSFRSFFPAAAATLHPDRTLSAIRSIWSRYHTWGNVSAIRVHGGETVVRVTDTLRDRLLCQWTCEMLDTLVVLSGGSSAATSHDSCEAEGGDACVFRVAWQD
jgi:diguanylate cyclase (GGDEF)-like protein